jgi:hypothetical protein
VLPEKSLEEAFLRTLLRPFWGLTNLQAVSGTPCRDPILWLILEPLHGTLERLRAAAHPIFKIRKRRLATEVLPTNTAGSVFARRGEKSSSYR